jgi:hypothetical protein
MRVPRKSRYGGMRNAAQTLRLALPTLGHSSPQHCPTPCPHTERPNPLGEPLKINEVARLIGCSPWSVRQTLIPSGLPVFRSTAGGRLIFYRNQVVRWIEDQQRRNT